MGLIDYGQSKKLPDELRRGFARLVLALHREEDDEIAAALAGVGVVVDRHDPALAAKLAYGMFDTRGRQERGAVKRGCGGVFVIADAPVT